MLLSHIICIMHVLCLCINYHAINKNAYFDRISLVNMGLLDLIDNLLEHFLGEDEVTTLDVKEIEYRAEEQYQLNISSKLKAITLL